MVGELPIGIHFGLAEATYRADRGLGSSDKKLLRESPTAYWWGSWMNPARPEESDTKAMLLGRAVHTFALLGEEEFRSQYARCIHPGNVKDGKREREDAIFRGLSPIPADDFDRILTAGTMIRSNPAIREAFDGGAPEVSIVYERIVDGEAVRCKARFDYLRVRSISDLKSHDPMDGIPFAASCHRAIKKFNRAIQAADYLYARSFISRLVADGCVYGDHDPAWLRAVSASREWAFVLVFWARSGPPLTWGGYLSPTNPQIEIANRDIETALRRFVDYRREFGEEAAWVRPTPLAEIDPADVDQWWQIEAA